jgi:hypothetical protein
MNVFRRAWTGLFALAILAIACGSFSPVAAMAGDAHAHMHHKGTAPHRHDGQSKSSGSMVSCGMTCAVVAPGAPFAVPDIAPSPLSFWSDDLVLAGARTTPDPPPPRQS